MQTSKTTTTKTTATTTRKLLDLDNAFELKQATLHNSITIPSLFITEKTLNEQKCKGFKFYFQPKDDIVILTNGTAEAFTPMANVQMGLLK